MLSFLPSGKKRELCLLLNAVLFGFSFNASKIVKISFVVHEREQKTPPQMRWSFIINDLKS